jgi:hypothetical protein
MVEEKPCQRKQPDKQQQVEPEIIVSLPIPRFENRGHTIAAIRR